MWHLSCAGWYGTAFREEAYQAMTMESLESILRRIAARNTWNSIGGFSDDCPGNRETGNPGTAYRGETSVDRCPICNGAGWLTRRVPVTDPDFGTTFPCACQQTESDPARRIAALARYSKLGFLRQATFAAANPAGPTDDPFNRRAFAEAFAAASRYADNPEGWVTFAGPSGSGKTYLAAAIANRQIERGNPALFLTAADLLDYLRGGFDDAAEVGFVDLYEQVRSAPLLALDDLPTRMATPWSQERLFQLLAWRHSARLPTIVTLRGAPNRLDEFLRTRLESVDGFARLHYLGRISPVFGQRVGAIPPNMRRRMTFASFDTDWHKRLTGDEKASLKSAKSFVQRWTKTPTNWILLSGSDGAGKTHLAVAAAVARQEAGDEVFFASVADLLDHLRAAFAPDSPITHDDLLWRIKTVNLLVLDDMGAERTSDFAEEKLFQILDYRYAEQLPAIITTSHLDVTKQLRPRIFSRLSDVMVVTKLLVIGPDYRQGPHGGDGNSTRRLATPRRNRGL